MARRVSGVNDEARHEVLDPVPSHMERQPSSATALHRAGVAVRAARQRASRALQLGAMRTRCRIGRYCRSRAYTDADPLKLIYVDPMAIVCNQQKFDRRKSISHSSPRLPVGPWRGFHIWKCIGRVSDGPWDEAIVPLQDLVKFRSLTSYLAGEISWAATELVERVSAGRNSWHGEPRFCKSEAEVSLREREVQALHERIRTGGYRARDQDEWYSWREIMDEVTVNISRAGKLIRNHGGTHRLAIAQSLRLDRIPVRVLVRHRRWQDVRDTVQRTKIVPAEYVGHPDLADLKTWREEA